MVSASDKQIDGTHYADMPEHAQPWNVLQHWLTPEEYRGWQKGNAIVYLARERQKGGDTDVRKASHHLERLIEEFPGEGDIVKTISPETVALPVVEMPSQPDADGWIKWNGGECPVQARTRVDVRDRFGAHCNVAAGDVNWSNSCWLAYRLHKPVEPENAADPHAELKKTWKPGQRWQALSKGEWQDLHVPPKWWAGNVYRRHPDDVDQS